MVQMPDVENGLKDTPDDIKYTIMAYHKLSSEEMHKAVQQYINQNGGKKPPRGSEIVITWTLGRKW